jgi:acetylglutamate synthase
MKEQIVRRQPVAEESYKKNQDRDVSGTIIVPCAGNIYKMIQLLPNLQKRIYTIGFIEYLYHEFCCPTKE